ncbi:TRAP transporter substrate-binding protein [Aquisalibacillus elongatus]|uniref:Tripartite ATP-independent transporter DctP family solute receptor n=1 Tax=Aquisalibacillus elongatus TaxID=485577 RepID=A0A3N5BA12_9BACI|nr:TRAP transporter substrate-binding protein [Aquisalibacillus elongatus]RPF54324.1 tripartite ATP-independent transporter DctP family solute receptor [Aquisalibacillus elongatus]
MKKLLLLVVSASLLILAACGGGDSESGGDSVSLKLAHSGSDSHQYQIAAEKFKELVEEKTDGEVSIEIHGNATLGSEADAVEQVMDGSIEMTTVAADSSFSNTVEEMNVFGIPYLFEDEEHIYSVLDGDIGQELLGKTEEYGMKGLGYWEVGFRHLTNNQSEINEPADVEGLEIRVQPSDVWEQHMTALGAEPTPVDFNELYSALDQGVVDGQENPLPTIDSMKFYEVQDYVALTSHTYSPAIVVMNQGIYDDLSEEHQQAIDEAVEETTDYHRETLAEKEDEIIQKLEDNGVTITEPNREAFREATKDVKNAVTDRVPEDLINRIEDAR